MPTLTKIAHAFRRAAWFQRTARGAVRAKYPSTHSTMVPPSDEVERHVTLVADLHTFVGQPERAIVA